MSGPKIAFEFINRRFKIGDAVVKQGQLTAGITEFGHADGIVLPNDMQRGHQEELRGGEAGKPQLLLPENDPSHVHYDAVSEFVSSIGKTGGYGRDSIEDPFHALIWVLDEPLFRNPPQSGQPIAEDIALSVFPHFDEGHIADKKAVCHG
jgi:hypothetical protein